MSTLAVVATFAARIDEGNSLSAVAHKMMDAVPARAPDGIGVAAAPGAALGFGRLVVSRQQGHALCPLEDRAAGLTVVADVRIDNRDDLKARWRLPADATDTEIVLRGYEREGDTMVAHLIGDFAFAVWDARKQRLFAARDPFGVRPLVYRVAGDRLLVASDVEQILAVDPSARVVDETMVVDWLMYQRRSVELTFFAPIKNLAPGCTLIATRAGDVKLTPWWRPHRPQRFRDEREAFENFRMVFARAVKDRLLTDHPVLVHLSGGFDSTVAAIVAGQVNPGVSLRAVGAVHPGLDCDESVYMNATAAQLPYPHEWWDGTKPDLVDLERPYLAGPGLRIPRTNGTAKDYEIAKREGARVVISGHGGDAFHPVWQVVRDCAREGRWDLVARSTILSRNQPWRARRGLTLSAAKLFTPPWARRFKRAMRPTKSAPEWLAPRLREIAPLTATDVAATREGLIPIVGWAGAFRLDDSLRPVAVEAVANEQRGLGDAAAECRCPFLDVRVLSAADDMPLPVWRPPHYRWRLHALAYADVLPAQVQARKRKTLFGAAVINRSRAAAPSMHHLLAGQPNVARFLGVPVVDVVQSRLPASGPQAISEPEVRGGPADSWMDSALIWNLATLEAWLRLL